MYHSARGGRSEHRHEICFPSTPDAFDQMQEPDSHQHGDYIVCASDVSARTWGLKTVSLPPVVVCIEGLVGRDVLPPASLKTFNR